jgi:nucleoside-diphosphate-sugar epimerase
MQKILVTGGSGFIGTNMIDLLLKYEFEIINYDIEIPRCKDHLTYWVQLDLLDKKSLCSQLSIDKPDFIIHLAARTDLNENKNLDGYKVNIDGVRNLMECAKLIGNLKRIMIASSMLVCKLGYFPKSFDDYNPNSLYGESKVMTEKIVKEYMLDWVIIRPTSIWGPWFAQPYRNFFDLVLKGIYFNIPAKHSSTKTYGFVENTCEQIYRLMLNNNESVKHNYFYLGDLEPINISNWAIKIRLLNNQSKPITLSKWFLKLAAHIGDFLKTKFYIQNFPINSFRYQNMTNDNVIQDLKRTIDITHVGRKCNLDDETLKTLNWIKKTKNNL